MSSTALDRWEQRLQNWALWYVSGSGGSAVSALYLLGGATRRSKVDARVVLVGEALDTDALIRKLSRELQQAILAWYVWTGPVAGKAAQIGCHENTLRYRVEGAKLRLRDLSLAALVRAAKAKKVMANLSAPP